MLEAKDVPGRRIDDDTLERTLEVLRRRVDQLGVSEPSLQRSGERRLIVELPGVSDPEQALAVIGRTAQLTFRPVLALAPGDAPEEGDVDVLEDEEGRRLHLGPPEVTGDAVKDAQGVIEPSTGGWHVQLEFRRDGAGAWASLTGRAACAPGGDPTRRVAIVLDQEVISSPQVSPEIECNEGIAGGSTVITGDFSEAEAKQLALLIRAGALPVPVEVVERRTVGPTLGAGAIEASVHATALGSVLTVAYIVAYYRLLGALAVIGLAAYGVISFAALLGLDATLTLPGVAGFVLAVGMAVDANVLVFERIKEEQSGHGKIVPAVREGFGRAWSAIADSNATTLLAAGLLFFLASGPVRGFGVTLTIGVIVSMFSALVVTRVLIELAVRSQALARRPRLLGMGVGEGLRRRLSAHPANLIGHAKVWFALSSAALAVAVAGLLLKGLDYGVEFTGGRLLEYSTQRDVDLHGLRAQLAREGFIRAVVQESGDRGVSVRTGRLDGEGKGRIEGIVRQVAGDVEQVRDEFIGPTIGLELRRKALLALGLALGAQLVYLTARFRWTYALSAVVATFHDVVLLLGVFAWLSKPIDGVFLAALLTVVGYSINDSVVVFDRIREQRRLRRNEPLARVANDAALQTIPRTINTGLGALFILLALFLLGGESLTDFALALIVGILVGTYSSMFTAAPLAVVIENARPAPQSAHPTASARQREVRPRARAGGTDHRGGRR